MEFDVYTVLLFIAVGLVFAAVKGINARMKPKKYVKKPEFSWDQLDDDGKPHD